MNFWNTEIKINDTILILTIREREKFSLDKVNNIISKIVIIKENREIYSDTLSKALSTMNIEILNLFFIDTAMHSNDTIIVNKDANIKLIKSSPEKFIEFINSDFDTFLAYNFNSIYIIRGDVEGPSFKYIKYLLKN